MSLQASAGQYDSASDDESLSLPVDPPRVNCPAYLMPRGVSPSSKAVHVIHFPWIVSGWHRYKVDLDTISPTLRGSAVTSISGIFVCHPGECDACKKPAFVDPLLPQSMFSILVECPHFPHVPDEYPERYPGPEVSSMCNKAIARILPLNSPVPQGSVVVVKHQVDPHSCALNVDLVIEDITASDIPVICRIVARWARNLLTTEDRVLLEDPRRRPIIVPPFDRYASRQAVRDRIEAERRRASGVPPFNRDASREAARDRMEADLVASAERALLDSFADLTVSTSQ
ncbi:hypothetical protein C8F01DRAFT_1255030 [Mycena amicta]|nr:hypothetical protein C8F01DRAFT_1255030 [Mycena amicta]